MATISEQQIQQNLKKKGKHIVLVEKNGDESLELYTFNRSIIDHINEFENNYIQEQEGALKKFLAFIKRVFRLQ